MEPTIHHITDLHVGPLHASANQPLFLARDKDEVQRDEVARYLKYLRRHKDSLPEIVVISGDMTSYASEAEFGYIADFLDELGQILRRGDERVPRICVVPGNHDLDWQAKSQQAKQERFRRLCQPRGDILFSPLSDPPYRHYQDTNLLVYAFNSCPMGGVQDPEIDAITERFAKVLGELASNPDHAKLSKALSDLKRIGRQDPGYIADSDLESMDSHLGATYDRVFKIAVMHHNPSLVPSADIDRYQSIINGAIVKHRLMNAGFDLVLHGHRHFPHCSYEEYFEDRSIREEHAPQYMHGLHTLGGPSLGSPADNARWFSIRIDKPLHVYEEFPPASLVTVRAADVKTGDFRLRANISFQMAVGKKVHSDFKALQELMGRNPPQGDPRTMELRKSIDSIQLGLLDLQAKVDDWEPTESNWQDVFQGDLPRYGFIYGIDLLGPASWLNPTYLQYVTQQFAERRCRFSTEEGDSNWLFSPELLSAIRRSAWDSPEIALTERPAESGQLEIARILIWEEAWLKETRILGMIDSLHRLFGVPVFVLNAEKVREFVRDEFVIAMNKAGEPIQCYAYDTVNGGNTLSVPTDRREPYLVRFRQLLAREDLRSISAYISA